MNTKNTAIIAFGSNIENRLENIIKSLKLIKNAIGVITLISDIFETLPIGANLNNNVLNGTLSCQTTYSPNQVLSLMLNIENILKRQRTSLTLDRTIDLDLIFYINNKNEIITLKTKTLELPHPRFLNRDFVMIPLAQIVPNLINPITKNSILYDSKHNKMMCKTIIKTYLQSNQIQYQ